MTVRTVRTWQGKIATEVAVAGSGPPLVFLHGPWGLHQDAAFLGLLAATHTVYAPKHPGTSAGDHDAIHEIDDWLDLVVHSGELLDRLELPATVLVGHSFGGMLACEVAAAMPERVSRLVLIDPIGLWREDAPVKNWMLLPPEQLRRALFADPAGAAAQNFFAVPSEDAARISSQVGLVWSQACTGKFVWPIADKGLKKRTQRIGMPTLIVWGEADGVVAPAYAEEFRRRIVNSRVAMVAAAAHLPHIEQTTTVAALVTDFLAA